MIERLYQFLAAVSIGVFVAYGISTENRAARAATFGVATVMFCDILFELLRGL